MPDPSATAHPDVSTQLLTATFDPRHGGRILSLKARTSGREWLVPPPLDADAADEARYGSSFTERTIHGWDEMLPTIDACDVDGHRLPDHGEVWAVPWLSVEPQHPAGVRLEVESPTLPLILSREAWARDDDIVLDYELTNTGSTALPVQWAAHPQFAVTPSAHVEFSPVPPAARVTSPVPSRDLITWRQVEQRSEAVPPKGHLKVWIEEPFALQAVTITDAEDTLTMCWRGAALPYAAVLWDRGEFANQPVLAIEPAMNASDSLARSVSLRKATRIRSGEVLSWQIVLSASASDFRHTLSDIYYK